MSWDNVHIPGSRRGCGRSLLRNLQGRTTMFTGQTRALFAAASLLVSTTALANLPTHAVVVSGELNPGHTAFGTFRNGTQIAINDAGQILFEGHDESDGNLWL